MHVECCVFTESSYYCIVYKVCYCCVVYLFCEFNKFWLAEKPADIMQFNVVKDKFVGLVADQLQTPTAQLTLDFTPS